MHQHKIGLLTALLLSFLTAVVAQNNGESNALSVFNTAAPSSVDNSNNSNNGDSDIVTVTVDSTTVTEVANPDDEVFTTTIVESGGDGGGGSVSTTTEDTTTTTQNISIATSTEGTTAASPSPSTISTNPPYPATSESLATTSPYTISTIASIPPVPVIPITPTIPSVPAPSPIESAGYPSVSSSSIPTPETSITESSITESSTYSYSTTESSSTESSTYSYSTTESPTYSYSSTESPTTEPSTTDSSSAEPSSTEPSITTESASSTTESAASSTAYSAPESSPTLSPNPNPSYPTYGGGNPYNNGGNNGYGGGGGGYGYPAPSPSPTTPHSPFSSGLSSIVGLVGNAAGVAASGGAWLADWFLDRVGGISNLVGQYAGTLQTDLSSKGGAQGPTGYSQGGYGQGGGGGGGYAPPSTTLYKETAWTIATRATDLPALYPTVTIAPGEPTSSTYYPLPSTVTSNTRYGNTLTKQPYGGLGGGDGGVYNAQVYPTPTPNPYAYSYGGEETGIPITVSRGTYNPETQSFTSAYPTDNLSVPGSSSFNPPPSTFNSQVCYPTCSEQLLPPGSGDDTVTESRFSRTTTIRAPQEVNRAAGYHLPAAGPVHAFAALVFVALVGA